MVAQDNLTDIFLYNPTREMYEIINDKDLAVRRYVSLFPTRAAMIDDVTIDFLEILSERSCREKDSE